MAFTLIAGLVVLFVKWIVDMIAGIPLFGVVTNFGLLQTIHKLGILYPAGFALIVYGLTHRGSLALIVFFIVGLLIFIGGGALI